MKIKLTRSLAALGAFATLAVASTFGASIYWDGDATAGNGYGGSGNWIAGGSPKNWAAVADGATAKWTDNAANTATFAGALGNVTISSSSVPAITASLAFDTAGYALNFNNLSYASLGTLAINNTGNTTIDFGSTVATANNIAFGASNLITWNGAGTLTILNYSGTDTLRFGINGFGLTTAQLNKINFFGAAFTGSVISSTGFVTAAIPEPSTTAMLGAVAALGLVLYKRRRQAVTS